MIFLFSLPQFITENKSFKKAILACAKNKTLRMVAIDDAYLYVMYGRSFRVQICQLLQDLFKIIFADNKQHYTLCLGMTATMTQSLLTALSQLTNID